MSMLQDVLVYGEAGVYIGAYLVKIVDCFAVLAIELLSLAFELVS